MTALLTIPAGVGIFVLRQPIIGALLQRGEFNADDADAAQRAERPGGNLRKETR